MATPPCAATTGAKRLAVPLPAAKKATSTPCSASSLTSATVSWRPANGTVVPALRALASGRSSATGNARSSRMRSTVLPAAPVAPTTATRRLPSVLMGCRRSCQRSDRGDRGQAEHGVERVEEAALLDHRPAGEQHAGHVDGAAGGAVLQGQGLRLGTEDDRLVGNH